MIVYNASQTNMKKSNKLTAKSTKGTDKPVGRPIRTAGKVKNFGGIILMALYQFANNGLISGRTGGDVKMRNGRSRRMVVPALVRNTFTSGARGLLATLSAQWNALTSTNRFNWDNFIMKASNRFGVIFDVKGKQAYVRCNANLVNAGLSQIADPNTTATTPVSPNVATVTIAVSTTIFDIATNIDTSMKYTLLYATKGFNAGVSKPSKSAYRLIGIIDLSVSSPVDAWAIYVAKFGVPAVGSKIFVQCKAIGNGSGLASAIGQNNSIVTA